jgi:hypothetical protein
MTPEDLQAIERRFEKAKRAEGPHALAKWAADNAEKLFAAARPAEKGAVDPPVNVEALVADTDAAKWAGEFCRVAKQIDGTVLDEGWVIGWFANAIETGRGHGRESASYLIQDKNRHAIEALRPFAALGSPAVVARMEQLAEIFAADEPAAYFAVSAEDGVVLARIMRGDCERAHELVQQADGEAA